MLRTDAFPAWMLSQRGGCFEVVDDGVTEPGDDPAENTHNFAETVEPEDGVFAPARVLNVQVSISDENWNQLRFEHRKPVEFW